MTTNEKRCVICNEPLPERSGNVMTCEGECRNTHTKEMMKNTNFRIKKQKIMEILRFLEKSFNLGIDVDEFSDTIAEIKVHNISIDDYVITSYYILSKSNEKSGLSIDDIEKAALQWDAINGFPRTRKAMKRVELRISKMESILPKIKSPEQSRRTENKIKRNRRLLKDAETRPKMGFSKNAYNLIRSKLKVAFCNEHEKVKMMMMRFAENHKYDDSFKDAMVKTYDAAKDRLLGKNPKVIVAGVFYSTTTDMNYAVTIEDVSTMTGVSKSSIDDVRRVLHA